MQSSSPDALLSAAAQRLARWRADAVLFVRECFGATPDRWQADVLRAASQGSPLKVRLAMLACAGPGKSTVLAWLGWWCLACHYRPGEHPQGIAMSMNGQNLMSGLAKELAKWHKRSDFLAAAFTWTSKKIYCNEHPETWFLEFRSTPKKATADEIGETLSGVHSTVMMFYLIDEAGSLPPIMLKRAEQGMGDPNGRGLIALAGNTTNKASALYAATKSKIGYFEKRITADPDDPERTPRVSREHAQAQIDEYPLGRKDPWVQAYVLGEFPDAAINQLLTWDDVTESFARAPRADSYDWSPVVFGVDVAREGLDRSCIIRRQGIAVFAPLILSRVPATDGAARVAREFDGHHGNAMFLDDTGGFGGDWILKLREWGYKPQGVCFGAGATDARYANKRAEMWMEMAKWVRTGGALPEIPGLIDELTEPTYSFNARGQMILEPKKMVAARLNRSPDIADALALTFAAPVAAPKLEMPGHRNVARGMTRMAETGIPKEWLES